MEVAQSNQLCSPGMEALGSYRTKKGKLGGWKIPRTGQLPCSLEVVDTSGFGVWVFLPETSTGDIITSCPQWLRPPEAFR